MRASLLYKGMISLAVPILFGGSVLAQSEPKQENLARVVRMNSSDKAGATAEWITAGQNWTFVANRNIPDDVGAILMPIDATLRSQLQVPPGQGLIVVELAPDGRAAKAGLKVSDILLTLADKPVSQHADLIQILRTQSLQADSNKPGTALALKFLRGGKPSSVNIRGESLVLLAAVSESKPNFYLGLPANPVDETFRGHLEIPQGTGMIIGEIVKGTPASKAGFKDGDILLSFDAQPVPDVKTLHSKIQAKGEHPAELQVLRAGKPLKLTATPEVRNAEALHFVSAIQSLNTVNYNVEQLPFLGVYTTRDGSAPPLVATSNSSELPSAISPSIDLNKKIDDLTAQVQALTKAVEGLQAAQVQGEKK